jgi:ATP synthase protein I
MSGRPDPDGLARSAREEAQRDELLRRDPEPSLGRRFGQIGVLGWMTIVPVLIGIFCGRALDRWLGLGITMTAALTMLGAAVGLWLAFRWMHQQ